MIGSRVICTFLHHAGEFPGVVLEQTSFYPRHNAPVVRVKLDIQDKPVNNLLYFDGEVPDEISSAYWQFCVPEQKSNE